MNLFKKGEPEELTFMEGIRDRIDYKLLTAEPGSEEFENLLSDRNRVQKIIDEETETTLIEDGMNIVKGGTNFIKDVIIKHGDSMLKVGGLLMAVNMAIQFEQDDNVQTHRFTWDTVKNLFMFK